MKSIKKLLAKMGIIRLVWTVDYDVEIRLRRVYKHPRGGHSCRGICGSPYGVRLLPGNITGGSEIYVKEWYNFEGNRRGVYV